MLESFNKLIPESKGVKLIHGKRYGYNALDLGYTDNTGIKRTIVTGLTKSELLQFVCAMIEGEDLTTDEVKIWTMEK